MPNRIMSPEDAPGARCRTLCPHLKTPAGPSHRLQRETLTTPEEGPYDRPMSGLIQTRRWTRHEYDRLIETGFFPPGDRVELLGGQLIVAEPQGAWHASTLGLVADALRAAFGSGWYVMVQVPIALDDESEPEPDVAVAVGNARDYRDSHPSSPVLVVEVAQSSLGLDADHKASLYARAGVQEYWIVNLVDNLLEVYRGPTPMTDTAFGWGYAYVHHLRSGDAVTPLAAPAARVPVADFLR
jgi:Uma2 family endonuclease